MTEKDLSLDGTGVLITGGTGPPESKLTEVIFKSYPSIRRLAVFSRDEQKQFWMAQRLPTSRFSTVRFFIGDVRDANRLRAAFQGIETEILE